MTTKLIQELVGLAVEKGLKHQCCKHSPVILVETPNEIFIITKNIDSTDKCLQAAIDKIKEL